MSTPLTGFASFTPRSGWYARLGIIAAVVVAEMLLASYLIQLTPVDFIVGPARLLRDVQHWLFRFLIAYAVSLAMLVTFRGGATRRAVAAAALDAPVRPVWGIAHGLLLVPFAVLSAELYRTPPALPFAVLALAWHACAVAAVLALLAAMAPFAVWTKAARSAGGLPAYALLPAAAAVAAIQGSQMLWAPAARLTFALVEVLLKPLLPTLHSDPATLTVSSGRFAVTISEICSGLEGVGLMLAFCAAWLWCFRREYYFPRTLLVVPLGVLLVFLLNAARIAALVLIGDAGFERVATVGFHSQAGWIAFNFAAFAIAILAQRIPWLRRTAGTPRLRATGHTAAVAQAVNPTAAYLMPLLCILAAGMIAHALSSGFDLLYPLRLAGAIGALWLYRRAYASLDLRFSWRALLLGAALFGVWVGWASLFTAPAPEPAALSSLPQPLRAAWIGCRLLAATLTVPLAEELAYRGYLMRRLINPRFESVAFAQVRWPALTVSAVAFGIMHGRLWPAGILAGLAYGAIARKSGRLGEAIAAHGTTNALLAGYVLLFGQWQLW